MPRPREHAGEILCDVPGAKRKNASVIMPTNMPYFEIHLQKREMIMNVAILYDTVRETEKAEQFLAGEPIVAYSLKQCYQHPEIDGMVVSLGQKEETVMNCVNHIKKENAMKKEKPIWIFPAETELQTILSELPEKITKQVELYLFHDIRYPFVTEDMIYKALQKAAVHGSAAIMVRPSEELFVQTDTTAGGAQEELEHNTICFMKYPAAIRGDSQILRKLKRQGDVLELLRAEKAHLCEVSGRYVKVCTKDDTELAEAILQMG